MRLLFITGLYPHEHIDDFIVLSNGYIQNAPNVFQWALIDGLQKNDVDYEVISLPFLPSFPLRYKHIKTPSGDISISGTKIGAMLKYCNLMVYKSFSIYHVLKDFLMNWIANNLTGDEKLVILTYTPYPPFLKAIRDVKKKYPEIVLATVVTDLVDDMLNFKSNRNLLKRIQCYLEMKETKRLYKYIDKYILLTSAMQEKIPESQNRNIIVEGIASDKEFQSIEKDREIISILYAGTLQEFSGVDRLIDAFKKVKNNKTRLIICGKGTLTPLIEASAKEDPRIIYKGMLSNEEVIMLQRQATLLINPRRPDEEITRYSFPSKTLEYMSSGTPMVGYRLDGIPYEYYPFYYTIDGLGDDVLIETLNYVLALSPVELKNKAKEAYDFVMQHKTSKIQVKRILDFVRN